MDEGLRSEFGAIQNSVHSFGLRGRPRSRGGAIDSALGLGGLLLGSVILATALFARSRNASGGSTAGKAALVVGGIFLAIAVACGGFGIAFTGEMNRIEVTHGRIMEISEQVRERIAAGERVPTSVATIQVQLSLADDDLLDAWGHPLGLRKEESGEFSLTLLVSAGSDERMGTRDDIESSIDP